MISKYTNWINLNKLYWPLNDETVCCNDIKWINPYNYNPLLYLSHYHDYSMLILTCCGHYYVKNLNGQKVKKLSVPVKKVGHFHGYTDVYNLLCDSNVYVAIACTSVIAMVAQKWQCIICAYICVFVAFDCINISKMSLQITNEQE